MRDSVKSPHVHNQPLNLSSQVKEAGNVTETATECHELDEIRDDIL